jgi:AAA+ superfamily predicted ATPase
MPPRRPRLYSMHPGVRRESLVREAGRLGRIRRLDYECYLDACYRFAEFHAYRAPRGRRSRHRPVDEYRLDDLLPSAPAPSEAEWRRYRRAFERFRLRFTHAIAAFPLERIRAHHGLSERETLILARLMSLDTGLYDREGVAWGFELLRMVSSGRDEFLENRRLLSSAGKLRSAGLIVAAEEFRFYFGMSAGGARLADLRFSLTPHTRRELFGALLARSVAEPASAATYRVHEARVSLADVILAPAVRRAVEAAIAETLHRDVLFGEWGFDGVLRAGRGTAMLFMGPPGTGKTMTAEAVARELGRPLMVANWARIQDCYVGETEKNVEKLFCEARGRGAVLFLDEADALLASRESAVHSWELSQVNVALQEIERFDGVLILATNLAPALDRALESRMALKVQFPEPGPREREAILRRHVPDPAPLAGDVDLAAVARRFELNGRQIRNVARGAARRALHRAGRDARIEQRDFVEAAEAEAAGMAQPRSIPFAEFGAS